MTKPSAEGGKALMNPSDVVILLLDDDRDFQQGPQLGQGRDVGSQIGNPDVLNNLE
jgi:hypothetical protein